MTDTTSPYTPKEQANYTPTDEDVKQRFIWGDFPFLTGPGQRGAMWDRWLAAHDQDLDRLAKIVDDAKQAICCEDGYLASRLRAILSGEGK